MALPELSLEDRIRNYLVVDVGLKAVPGDDDLLVEKGFVVSAQLLELVDFMEQAFGVQLTAADVTPRNLSTIARMAAMVRQRLQSPEDG